MTAREAAARSISGPGLPPSASSASAGMAGSPSRNSATSPVWLAAKMGVKLWPRVRLVTVISTPVWAMAAPLARVAAATRVRSVCWN